MSTPPAGGRKPYPCCKCGCVACPQYGSNIWTLQFSSMSAGSATFASSTSGNELYTDLNSVLRNFGFGATTPIGGDVVQASINLSISGSWTYTGVGTITSPTFEIVVRDHCGKVWIHSAILRATIGLLTVTLISFTGGSEPASENCFDVLSQIATSVGSTVLAVTGSISLTP